MNERAIAHNRDAHDQYAGVYDTRHPEIFNDVEQARLAAAVAQSVRLACAGVGRAAGDVRALDVGCGTGNLTRHLLDCGVRVTAADLSPGFLARVGRRFGPTGRVEFQQLNGTDLRPLDDGSFDLVIAYSVLHHVPDYLALVREMVRVTRPGGVIVIDHERSASSWSSVEYRQFQSEAVIWPARRWWFWLQPARYWKRVRPLLEWRRWFDARWMPEGDLHVWPDDHVEWLRIEDALKQAGCSLEVREDYLLYEPRFSRDAWDRWRHRCSDMSLRIAQKHA